MRFRCPKCHGSDHLWRFVEVSIQDAYQEVDERLEPTGEAETEDAIAIDVLGPTGEYGCYSCDWQGVREKLEKIGIDGNPLPLIHKGQLQIGAAA